MIIIGGLVAAIGSIMPWTKAESILRAVSKNGTEGDGMITLSAGIIAVLAGVIVLAVERYYIATFIAAVAALAIIAVTVWNLADISGRAPGLWTDFTAVQAGEGIYIALIGGALVLIGAIVERVGAHAVWDYSVCPSCSRPVRPGDAVCDNCGKRLRLQWPPMLPRK
jgi:hypothetical protein